MNKSVTLATVLIFCGLILGVVQAPAQTKDDRTTDRNQNSATQNLARSIRYAGEKQVFDLRYALREGEIIRWEVEQVANTDASIAGYREESSLRSRSVIAWKVISVDSLGNMTFQDTLESAKEWQQVGDAEPISFDSQSDAEIPDIFKNTAETIGKPLTTTTIDPKGNVKNRIEHVKTVEFGMGRATLPLPASPVKIGDQWFTPDQLTARHSDGRVKQIKTRILYTLRDVQDGLATIAFRREVLTPIEDPRIKSQIQQKMNQGTISFDMVQGRVAQKIVHWDEKVQGFEGPDSYLHYMGNYTKRIKADGNAGATSQPATDQKTSNRASQIIKPRDGKPVIRK